MWVWVQSVFGLLAGFLLLVMCGDRLITASMNIALRWGVPYSLLALTLLAGGTSAPELFTSFLAAYQESGDLSVGNVFGSNVFNILAVGGISVLLHPVSLKKESSLSWGFLFLASLILVLFLWNQTLSQGEGLFLAFFLISFYTFSFWNQKKTKEEKKPDSSQNPLPPLLLGLVLGLAGITIGAYWCLSAGTQLGRLMGVSERVIAIALISVGTGLPELTTCAIASLRGRNDMALGNIIGSNIFNTLAIPSITATFLPLHVDEKLSHLDGPIMVGVTLALCPLFLFQKSIYQKTMGFFFLLAYAFYISQLH